MGHRHSDNEIFEANFENAEDLSASVEAVLRDTAKLDSVGLAAGAKSRSWSEAAHGLELIGAIKVMRSLSMVLVWIQLLYSIGTGTFSRQMTGLTM